MSAVCPVYPQQQTSPDTVGTSHLCHQRKSSGSQSLACDGRGAHRRCLGARGAVATCLPPRRAALLTVATQASGVAATQGHTYALTRPADPVDHLGLSAYAGTRGGVR